MFLKIVAWAATIIVVIVGTLVVIGLMASAQAGPSLRGFGPEDAEEKVSALPPYEVKTFTDFLLAATTGNMPGNANTKHPVFTAEGMELFKTEYVKWAPEPYSKIPVPAGPFGNMPGDSPPPLMRVMLELSGIEDIWQTAFTTREMPKELELSFSCMKKKVWFGIAPMANARWTSKELDKEANIEEALAIIEQIVDIFKYFCKPEIQGSIRQKHNKIYTEIDVFQDACNALWQARGSGPPPFHLTRLYEDFMWNHLQYLMVQNRSWVFSHLNNLYNIWKQRFMNTMQSGRQLNETQVTVKIDHYAMMILNKMLDIMIDADIYIGVHPMGLMLPRPINAQGDVAVALERGFQDLTAPKATLDAVFARYENERISKKKRELQEFIRQKERERTNTNVPSPDFMRAPMAMIDREIAFVTLRGRSNDPAQWRAEPWVVRLEDPKIEKFGYVIYRLSYDQTDEEWAAFLEQLKEGIGSVWDGVTISALPGIRQKAKLTWVDGREHKIAEGDIASARTHFNSTKDRDTFPQGLQKDFFLAITPHSLKSFMVKSTLPSDGEGDFRPFLHAVDATFSVEPSLPSTPSSSNRGVPEPKYKPGHDGSFKILDQLIWTDLYAMSGLQSSYVYWRLSMQHPWGVYVGPTTGVRRRIWREMQKGLGQLLVAGKSNSEL